jgi:hypothetical protein
VSIQWSGMNEGDHTRTPSLTSSLETRQKE